MVQVETLGELGVFFTLFVVGLEFSPERLRKVPLIPIFLTCQAVFHYNLLVIYNGCYLLVVEI